MRPEFATDIAWAAGFFDGEGYVGCQSNNRGRNRRLQLAIGQTDRRPLERFQRSVLGVGHIYLPSSLKNRPGNAKPLFVFQTSKFEHVQAIVAMLWKYLSEPKQEQAARVFERYMK